LSYSTAIVDVSMKLSVPWSVKGIRPETRETAREAARRSGMSLGEWLNTVILHQAADDGSEYDDDEVVDGRELSAVNQKLDDLSRRIEHFARKSSGPAAYAPKTRNEREPDDSGQIAELIDRLDRRLDQFVTQSRSIASPPIQPAMQAAMHHMMHPQMMPQPGYQQVLPNVPPVRMPPALDMAVAEIAARQRALNGQPPLGQPPLAAAPQRQQAALAMAQPMPQPMLMPVPQQDLSGLEDQLRMITNQIETLRKPGVEEAINALRAELGDIAQALTEAMPRQAIDTIERQIQGLTHRIAEGRQAGVDAGQLTGVEHGLAEVRDALRTLTPAENLVGFNDAVAGLAHKIDLIVADKNPETLHQLEHAITTLRDMASHVASTEAVTGLAQHVGQLADRVEHLASAASGSDALNHLEHRISALADALAQRSEAGANVPPMLESLVQSLSDKIELLQQNRGDSLASSHLENQIVALVQRLDASDSRLGHLEAVERGLADLLVHMEELRTNKNSGGLRADNSPVVDELKSDMARTQDALHQVNGTLGTLVDRLAKLESGIRTGSGPQPAAAPPMAPPPMPVPAEHRAPSMLQGRKRPVSVEEFNEARQPIGRVAARAVVDPQPAAPAPVAPRPAPAPVQQHTVEPPVQQPVQQPVQRQAAPQPAPAQKRLPQAHNLPINPDLPPDEPLEPGSGPPKFRANPGARIAASEAALGGSGPNAAGGKSGFIAAARRAANAALQSKAERSPPAQPQVKTSADILDLDDPDSPSLRGKLMKRVKSLFIAASVAAIVVGSFQIAGTFFEFGKGDSTRAASRADDDINTASTARPGAPNRVAANPLAPAKSSGPVPPGSAPTTNAPLDYTSPAMPSLLSPPAMNSRPAAPSASIADVTGSIPTPSLARPPVTLPSTAPTGPLADRLPTAIGGNKLRSAAVGGDAGAAYEVAVRFAEGRGVPVSLEDAARWYERAAGKGLAPAQFRYASLLEKGQGVKKDLVQARKLYLAAAGKGNGKAMHNLAVLYAEGADGRPDYVNAAQWFRKAAQRGIADSQYNLGVLCARGLGTEKNAAESYQWFSLAAAQGDKESAKKRDEIAVHMDAESLAAAQRAVQNFSIEPQPQEATTVAEPAGGWDGVTSAPAAKPRQVGPLSLGSLQNGYR
jgi:localization factor PodJL